jgi:hypothetical protein
MHVSTTGSSFETLPCPPGPPTGAANLLVPAGTTHAAGTGQGQGRDRAGTGQGQGRDRAGTGQGQGRDRESIKQ